jgi:type VI protein secretion system component Hcp
MAKSKGTGKKQSVKVNDLSARKDPKGGNTSLSFTHTVDKASPILMDAPVKTK